MQTSLSSQNLMKSSSSSTDLMNLLMLRRVVTRVRRSSITPIVITASLSSSPNTDSQQGLDPHILCLKITSMLAMQHSSADSQRLKPTKQHPLAPACMKAAAWQMQGEEDTAKLEQHRDFSIYFESFFNFYVMFYYFKEFVVLRLTPFILLN